jgi:hypothetical protein
MFSSSAQLNRCWRAATAILADAMVLSRYCGMAAINSANHDSLCQLGFGLISSGASFFSIHFRPLTRVDVWFQTSALEADSWPPLAYEVSIAG